MGMSVDAIIIVIAVGILGLVVLKILKKKSTAKAAKLVNEMYAVWAEMGPYENGEASRIAMGFAYQAVINPKSDKCSDTFDTKKHAEAYDSDPQRWENLRLNILSNPKMPGFEDQLTLAKGMAAANLLNEGIFKDAGFQAGFERDTNGNFVIVNRGLQGGDIGNELKSPEDALIYAAENAVGKGLFNDKSYEAEVLVYVLKIIYNKINDRDIEHPHELGKIYLYMGDFIKANPDSGISKLFVQLNTSWLNSKANPDELEDPSKLRS